MIEALARAMAEADQIASMRIGLALLRGRVAKAEAIAADMFDPSIGQAKIAQYHERYGENPQRD